MAADDDARGRGDDFEFLEDSHDTKGGGRRQPAAGLVQKGGSTRLNANAAASLLRWARDLGLDPTGFGVRLGANEAAGTVAIQVADPLVKGVAKVRVYDEGTSVSLNLRPIFRLHPDLRPTTAVEATAKESKDKNGKDCLVLKIKGATEHRAEPRPRAGKKKKGPENPPAPGASAGPQS